MKLSRFVISDYKQIKYLNLDLTYPLGHSLAGKPLEKICFIGKNGTGKSNILNFIKNFISSVRNGLTDSEFLAKEEETQFCFEFDMEGMRYLVGRYIKFYPSGTKDWRNQLYFFPTNIIRPNYDLFTEIFINKNPDAVDYAESLEKEYIKEDKIKYLQNCITEDLKQNGLLIYSPTEFINSNYELSNLSTLEKALKNNTRNDFAHEISFKNLKDFWDLLINEVQLRERKRDEFENDPKNLEKTKQELIKEFNDKNPEILEIISKKWKVILDIVGLHFDATNAKKPRVSNDELEVYIKNIKSGKRIQFAALSSGIKSLIFSLGYMIAIYNQKNIKSGFVLFDEPEFSLFPDILLKLIDIYTNKDDFNNTQFFFATHSPLIASQFDPSERICLHFTDDNNIYATRGISPLGDNPDDILLQDFGLEEIMPVYGVSKWNEFLKLKKQIEDQPNSNDIKAIIKKFSELQTTYNFPLNEPNTKTPNL